MYKLFLDDVRTPFNCSKYMHTKLGPDNLIYLEDDWVIVRNFDDFKIAVRTYGIPNIVSFDHDLADMMYDPETHTESFTYKEQDGSVCAKWLMEFCEEHEKYPDKIWIHSANVWGRKRIRDIITDFNQQAYG